jgi:ATP-dependent Clp protease adaptor protein ClpS
MSFNDESQLQGNLLTLVEKSEKTKVPSRFKVLLHNDDFTSVEFVVEIIRGIFHVSHELAEQLTMEVHHKGVAVVGIYTHEVAETKAAQVMKEAERQEYPLLCTVAPI